MTKKALEGIKVADFVWQGVGPATSKYLAEHGATVIRIESHKRPDGLRTVTPFAEGKPGINRSMYYGKFNSGKYSVSIDLSNPKGIELVWKLIMWADIMTESFTPKAMRNWGLDYPSVVKKRPDIIYMSSCGMGQTGPCRMYPAHGTALTALCGISYIFGWPDRPPTNLFEAYTDEIAPRFNALGILAALEYRRRTGKGQWLDCAQVEGSMHFVSPLIMDYAVNGRIAERNGNRDPNAAPHGVFPCKGNDEWVAITVFNDNEWQAFCQASGHAEWIEDPRFATFLARKDNEDELEKLIAQWTANITAETAEEILQKAEVPAHKLLKSSEIMSDPQIVHRGYYVRMDHREMGNVAYDFQTAFILSKTPREIERPSPCLGEHNEFVFKELLGMTDEDVSEYLIEGAITTET